MRGLETSKPIHSVEEWVIAVIALVLALGSILQGVLLIWGDPERMTGPSYQVIRDMASGTVWGIGFLIGGLLALVGQVWRLVLPARVGHGTGAVFCLVFAAAFIYGGTRNGQASFTWVAAYLTIGLIHLIVTRVSPPRAGLYEP